MDKYRCEMFGHFTYADRLTYQELLDKEAALTLDMQALLECSNAVHIDFTPLGDELMVQCAFDAYDQDLFHTLCDGVQGFLGTDLEGQLLFVDKHLAYINIYLINGQTWQESCLDIPRMKTAKVLPKIPVPTLPKPAKSNAKKKKGENITPNDGAASASPKSILEDAPEKISGAAAKTKK